MIIKVNELHARIFAKEWFYNPALLKQYTVALTLENLETKKRFAAGCRITVQAYTAAEAGEKAAAKYGVNPKVRIIAADCQAQIPLN